MPVLTAMLPYLLQSGVAKHLRRAVAEVCLSASFFGLLPWKELILQLIREYHPEDLDLMQQLATRTRILDHLQFKQNQGHQIDIPQDTERSSRLEGLFSEQELIDLKILVGRNASLLEVTRTLRKLEPLREERTAEEKNIWFRAQACYARALKNTGQFTQAAAILKNL